MNKLDTRDKLINWFCKEEPNLVHWMKRSNHAADPTNHPFHLEDSVWTHTLMVMTYAEAKNMGQVILTVGMLHDIGKCSTRQYNEEKNRFSFNGHEGVSTVNAIDILAKMEISDNFYTNAVRLLILKLISLHGIDLNDGTILSRMHRQFREADKMGAVRNVDENIFGQYGTRKYSNRGKVRDGKEIILMVGLPCSGKTTYIANNFKDYYIISRDDEIENFCDSLDPSTPMNPGNINLRPVVNAKHNDKFEFVYGTDERYDAFTQYFDKKLIQVSKTYDKVVIDMTLMALGKRRGMLNIFQHFHARAVVLFLGKKEIYYRNSNRVGKTVATYKFDVMSQKFTLPILEEGFEKIDYYLQD